MTPIAKWKLFAPLGLTCVGAGVSTAIFAGGWMMQGVPFWQWFSLGTLALIGLNSGIALVAEAVKNRILHDLAQKNGLN